MDVWGLGGLLAVALTGAPPGAELPGSSGLNVIVNRCRAPDPAARYADGAAVANDLRAYLRNGILAVEKPSFSTRIQRGVRRHPLASALALATVFGLAQWGTATILARQAAERTARAILEGPLPDPHEGELLLAQLAELPATPAVRRAQTRLHLADETTRILASATRFQHSGPWPGEIADLTATLHLTGIDPAAPGAADRLATHPNRPALLRVLVHLQRALLVGRIDSPLVAMIPALLTQAAPDAAWRSLADLLRRPIITNHDLELCPCTESEAALHQADTADALLALYAPDARLEQLAQRRIAQDPGAFWPRIVAARAELGHGQTKSAQTNALVALGADPTSLWPHLILAYAALADDDAAALARETAAALVANPDHLEAKTLHALVLARSDRRAEAQALIDGLHEAPHLQHHLQHRMGHPMEQTVAALVAAGIVIPAATPAAGPVVRPPGGE